MATVKMKKGDLIANINNSPESIAHAYTLGYIPVNEAETDATLNAGLQSGPGNPGPDNPGPDKPGNTGPETPSQENPGPAQPSTEQPGPAAPTPENPGTEQHGKSDKPGDPKNKGLFGKKDKSEGA